MQANDTRRIDTDAIVSRNETDSCGESPFWSASDHAWYWTDIPAGRIHRWQPDSQCFDAWKMPEQIGCIAQRSDGGLIAAGETGLFHLDPHSGQYEKIAEIHFPAEGMRFNDGKCDRAGRFWVTSFMTAADKRPVGSLFRYDASGLVECIAGGFMTPNGMAFSPDNRTLYISDSHTDVRKVWAFDFDLAAGEIGERRLFIDMADLKGRPDGAAIDTDGNYWVAGMDAGCIYRISPTGKLDKTVALPVRHPTMPAFGGKDMKEMFVTSLKRGNVPVDQDPSAGNILRFDPEAKGIAETPFRT